MYDWMKHIIYHMQYSHHHEKPITMEISATHSIHSFFKRLIFDNPFLFSPNRVLWFGDYLAMWYTMIHYVNTKRITRERPEVLQSKNI